MVRRNSFPGSGRISWIGPVASVCALVSGACAPATPEDLASLAEAHAPPLTMLGEVEVHVAADGEMTFAPVVPSGETTATAGGERQAHQFLSSINLGSTSLTMAQIQHPVIFGATACQAAPYSVSNASATTRCAQITLTSGDTTNEYHRTYIEVVALSTVAVTVTQSDLVDGHSELSQSQPGRWYYGRVARPAQTPLNVATHTWAFNVPATVTSYTFHARVWAEVVRPLTPVTVTTAATPTLANAGIFTRSGTDTTQTDSAQNSLQEHGSSSSDGRYLVFTSAATDLVSGVTGGIPQVYRRDMVTGTTVLVSQPTGTTVSNAGNKASGFATISADGRYVAFDSFATNLIAGDTNAVEDIFVRDLTSNTTIRLPTALITGTGRTAGFSYRPYLSGSGTSFALVYLSKSTNVVALPTGATANYRVYRYLTTNNFTSGTTDLASPSTIAGSTTTALNVDFSEAVTSAAGTVVGFIGAGSNIVVTGTNSDARVYVRTYGTGGTTVVASTTSTGTIPAGSCGDLGISSDGGYISFASLAVLVGTASNVNVYLRRATDASSIVLLTTGGASQGGDPHLSSDGRYTIFQTTNALVAADTNAVEDVYMYDRVTGTTALRTQLVAVKLDGTTQSTADTRVLDISADGRYGFFVNQGAAFGFTGTNRHGFQIGLL